MTGSDIVFSYFSVVLRAIFLGEEETHFVLIWFLLHLGTWSSAHRGVTSSIKLFGVDQFIYQGINGELRALFYLSFMCYDM